jgi:hypothetical protein
MQRDTLLFKELFEGRFGDFGVVVESVECDSAFHICGVVVGGEDLLLG